MARIESCQGNHESAVKVLRKAQDLLPKNSQINLDLAMLHMRMGEKYFAVAAEELDEIQLDIGDEKYVSLVYLRSFLGESKKAADALELCDKSVRRLAEAHMLLIQGDKKKANKLAEEKISSGDTLSELSNLAEFYLCSGDFDKAMSICTSGPESGRTSNTHLKLIESLARFFKHNREALSKEEKGALIADWYQTSWNFRELLMFRESCKKIGEDYCGRLEIIEELIQFQELLGINSHGRGLIAKEPLLKRHRVRFVIASD